jgi:hypothetical protein
MNNPSFLPIFTEKIDDESVIPELAPIDLSVDAVTPITRQAIPQINKMAWRDMSSTDLQDQYTILESRYYTILGLARPDIAEQMQNGMAALRKLIRKKIKEESEEDYRKRTPGGIDGKA